MTTLCLTRSTAERLLDILDSVPARPQPALNAADSIQTALSESDDPDVVVTLNAYETEATLAVLIARTLH